MTKRDALLALCSLVEAGDLSPVVGTTYPLTETGDAISHAGSGHARGKIVASLPGA